MALSKNIAKLMTSTWCWLTQLIFTWLI